jgi:hypothetical protein
MKANHEPVQEATLLADAGEIELRGVEPGSVTCTIRGWTPQVRDGLTREREKIARHCRAPRKYEKAMRRWGRHVRLAPNAVETVVLRDGEMPAVSVGSFGVVMSVEFGAPGASER